VSVTVKRTTCNRDCPDACSILATVTSGRVTALAGDPEHPITRGSLCFRTGRFLERQYAPERLTQPLLRKAGALTPVSWEEALDFAAERLLKIRAESGPASIFHYRSGGSLGILKVLADHFFEQFGPVTIKRGDICSGAGDFAQLLDFGEEDSHHLEDLLNSRHILLWGKNAVVSSPHTLRVLRDARARGAEVVLIDPVHHKTANHVDQSHSIRPGGDFALAMAVGRTLFERGWVDPEAARYTDHLARFEALTRTKTVEAWCVEADVPVALAEDLARRLGLGKPTAILVGWGMGRRVNGAAIVRALDALATISGNIGIPGGGVSFYFKRRGAFDTGFVRGAEVAPRTLSEPLFGAEILAAQDPPIRAVWITAGNPVVMLPESLTVKAALSSRELVVVVDSVLTDTAELATLVLPTDTLLEADDLVGSYGHHYLGAVTPVVPPPAGVKSDLQILQELATRVGLSAAMAGDARQWKERILAPRLSPHGITLETLEQGYVRNPLAPPVLFADRKFPTPSGRVNLLQEAPATVPPLDPAWPLFLMSLSTEKAQASQGAVRSIGPLSCRVHPQAAPGFSAGERVDLVSPLGRIQVVLDFDEAQRLDVAIVPKGGELRRGTAPNALIRAQTTDHGEGGALYDERVRIERIAAPSTLANSKGLV